MRGMFAGGLAALLSSACAGTPKVAYEDAAAFPPRAEAARAEACAAAAAHPHHAWRDSPPLTSQGWLRGYVEIGLGDSDKQEFSMADNALKLDRVIDADLGGYPINYGYIPRTIAFDGDPLDILVLGPRLAPGAWAEGVMLGVLHMEDEKGDDPKIVISPMGEHGRPLFTLTPEDKARVGAWFQRYKANSPGKFSRVSGWGDTVEAERLLAVTRAFFDEGPCRSP
jgi:inorganic pyrophosphatase